MDLKRQYQLEEQWCSDLDCLQFSSYSELHVQCQRNKAISKKVYDLNDKADWYKDKPVLAHERYRFLYFYALIVCQWYPRMKWKQMNYYRHEGTSRSKENFWNDLWTSHIIEMEQHWDILQFPQQNNKNHLARDLFFLHYKKNIKTYLVKQRLQLVYLLLWFSSSFYSVEQSLWRV